LLTAPAPGVVAAVHAGEPDHDAFRGFPSIGYALTQRRRAADGWTALAGNYVIIEVGTGEYVALCHLERHSVRVAIGQAVGLGDGVGRCGNSGNSTEPHVHVQAMTGLEPQRANAVPVTFEGGLPRNREVVDIS
jgi:murein DD-endopeptidase MepM/ murein hydrolase activator NlpD